MHSKEPVGMRRVKDGGIALVVLLGALIAYKPFAVPSFDFYDAGIAAYGAVRVGAGFVPYADMYDLHGPAPYYLRALLFYLFGPSIQVMNTEFLTLSAVYVATAYWALRGSSSRGISLMLAALAASLAVIFTVQFGIAYIALLVAVGCVVRYAHALRTGWLVATGMAIGICGAARWDFGVYGLASFGLALVFLPSMYRAAGTAVPGSTGRASQSRRLAVLFLAAGITAVPFYLVPLVRDPAALFRSIGLAVAVFPYRTLPWPPLPSVRDVLHARMTFGQYLDRSVFIFPAYAAFVLIPVNLLSTVIALKVGRGQRPSAALFMHTSITSLLGLCLLRYGSSRADLGHLLPMTGVLLLSVPLPLWCLRQLRLRESMPSTLLRHAVAGLLLSMVLPSGLLGVQVILQHWSQPQQPRTLQSAPISSMTASSDDARLYNAVVAAVQRYTDPGDFIFSGDLHHDELSENDVLLYFASGRHAGVRDYSFDPGATTRLDTQARMVADLQRNHVQLVVLRDWGFPMEANKSRQSSGVTVLDDYIDAHYAVAERIGPYFFLLPRQRDGGSCARLPSTASNTYGMIDVEVDAATGDTTVRRDGQIRLEGWASAPIGGAPLDHVEVTLNDKPVHGILQCIPRPDVAAVFGPDALHSGWYVTIDVRAFSPVGPLSIVANVVDRDGQRHPLQARRTATFPEGVHAIGQQSDSARDLQALP